MLAPRNTLVHAIGDFSPPEFADAEQLLRGGCDVVFDTSPAAACERLLRSRRWPELIVVAESRPGQLPHADLDRLQQLAPLARCVALLGPWCEGEARSGAPWPGVTRTYWHQWTARWSADLLATPDQCKAWNWSSAASCEDRLLGSLATGNAHARLIGVVSDLPDIAEMLCETCVTLGHPAVWLAPHQHAIAHGVSLIVWDGLASQLSDFRQLESRFGPIPRLALLSFPRLHDREQFLAAGAMGLLSQPFLVNELRWQLDRCTPFRLEQTPRAAA